MNTSGQCFCLLYFALFSTASLLLYAVAMLRKSLSLFLSLHSLSLSLSLTFLSIFSLSLHLTYAIPIYTHSFSRCEPLSCKCLKCPQAWRSCRTRIRPCRCVCCLSTGDETQEINPNETTIECSKGLCFCVCCKRNIPKPDRTTPKEASVDDDNVNESQPLVGSVNLSGK